MGREDGIEARVYDQVAITQQCKKKIEIMKEKNIVKSGENFIDALYYHEMYRSTACWMSFRAADVELKKLNSKSAKLIDLKENI